MPRNTPKSVQRRTRPEKPAKPHPDFPLFAHASGQWAKKVRGKLHYFGVWADLQAALERWIKDKDHLLAGRALQPDTEGLTVRELCNRYLSDAKSRVPTELSQRSWHDYDKCCERIIRVFTSGRLVADLRPDDFGKLRRSFAKTHAPATLHSDISRCRVVFNWAYDSELIDRPVRYGKSFEKPSALVLARVKKNKMLEAGETRKLLEEANPTMRAMIYLGINAGLGNADCARLTFDKINGEWLDYPREKTGANRRCRLWPETIQALKAVRRRLPKDGAHKDRVFITKQGGSFDPKSITDNPVSKEFAKLLKKLDIHRPGLGFYSLRHTFCTIAQQLDIDATRTVMGHKPSQNDMTRSVYNQQQVSDQRLFKVAKYVRRWLQKSGCSRQTAED